MTIYLTFHPREGGDPAYVDMYIWAGPLPSQGWKMRLLSDDMFYLNICLFMLFGYDPSANYGIHLPSVGFP